MRIDLFLLEKGYVKTRSQATDLIKRGLVCLDGDVITKAGHLVKGTEHIDILKPLNYVSRGGLKLEDAITSFGIDLKDKTILDVGASTGGFTDCALKFGAKHVYAYDVGSDQLDLSLKNHPQVTSYEQTNILDVDIPKVDIILIDVSFTSIKPILRHVKNQDAMIIALIKPQFEAGMLKMKKGILTDLKKHQDILMDVHQYAQNLGFDVVHHKPSTIKGKQGNQEYLTVLKKKHQEDAII